MKFWITNVGLSPKDKLGIWLPSRNEKSFATFKTMLLLARIKLG
jgi:hypothetical protein